MKSGRHFFTRTAPWLVILLCLALPAAPWDTALADNSPQITSTTLQGPYTLGQSQDFYITAENPVGGTDYPHVQFSFTISGIQLADIGAFDYYSVAGGTWYPLPLSQALRTHEFQVMLVEGIFDVLGNRLHVPCRATAHNDEIIGEACHLGDIQDHRLFSLVGHRHLGAEPCKFDGREL